MSELYTLYNQRRKGCKVFAADVHLGCLWMVSRGLDPNTHVCSWVCLIVCLHACQQQVWEADGETGAGVENPGMELQLLGTASYNTDRSGDVMEWGFYSTSLSPTVWVTCSAVCLSALRTLNTPRDCCFKSWTVLVRVFLQYLHISTVFLLVSLKFAPLPFKIKALPKSIQLHSKALLCKSQGTFLWQCLWDDSVVYAMQT